MRTERGGRKGRRAHSARYNGVSQCHAFWFRSRIGEDPLIDQIVIDHHHRLFEAALTLECEQPRVARPSVDAEVGLDELRQAAKRTLDE